MKPPGPRRRALGIAFLLVTIVGGGGAVVRWTKSRGDAANPPAAVDRGPRPSSAGAADKDDDDARPDPPPRYALLGEVLAHDSGRGVPGATVRAFLVGGAVDIAVTDAEGGFFFDGLPRPVRELRFSARGFDDAVVPQTELPAVPEAFWSQRLIRRPSDEPGAEATAHARLEGTVVDRRGSAVTSYRLLTSPVDKSPRRRRRIDATEVQDSDGRFSLEVAPGTVAVGVTADGYRPLERTLVEVEEGETATVHLVLEPSVELHGRVTDATTGAPVVRARVALVGVSSVSPLLTDDDGRFTFRSLPEENANLIVIAAGYVELNAGGIDGRRSRDQRVELELSPRRPGVAGEVVGIGVAVAHSPEGVAVRNVYPGSPAEGVLEPGDVILEVDGERLAGRGLRDSMGAIRGEAGTTIRLVVQKQGGGEHPVTLERRRVELPEG